MLDFKYFIETYKEILRHDIKHKHHHLPQDTPHYDNDCRRDMTNAGMCEAFENGLNHALEELEKLEKKFYAQKNKKWLGGYQPNDIKRRMPPPGLLPLCPECEEYYETPDNASEIERSFCEHGYEYYIKI